MIMDRAITAPGHRKNVVYGLNATEKIIWRNKWNSLVNQQVKTLKIFEYFPVNQNMYPLNFNKNVYIFSIIKTD